LPKILAALERVNLVDVDPLLETLSTKVKIDG
jgi:hypothetical protein